MAARAYHTPDNVEILDMHRGADTSQVRFPEGGCVQPKPNPRLVCLAFHLAKQQAKADLLASGIRRAYIEHKTVFLMATKFMEERREEFLARAQQMIERWEANINKSAQRRKP